MGKSDFWPKVHLAPFSCDPTKCEVIWSELSYQQKDFWLHSFCGKWESWDPVNRFNHTNWMAVVTPTARPKSVSNRCVIDFFLSFSVGVRAFVIGLSQISSFFSYHKELIWKIFLKSYLVQCNDNGQSPCFSHLIIYCQSRNRRAVSCCKIAKGPLPSFATHTSIALRFPWVSYFGIPRMSLSYSSFFVRL